MSQWKENEIEQSTWRKELSCSWVAKIDPVNIVILLKITYKLYTTIVNISMTLITEL